MNTQSKKLLVAFQIILFLNTGDLAIAQESFSHPWDLNQCINYALEHNIQVNKKKLSVLTSEADLLKTKSERLPTINGSISESFSNAKDQLTGSWDLTSGTSASISSNLSIYNGGIISNSIKQSQINVDIANLDIEVTKNSITLSITQAYLNVLYSKESLDYSEEILSTSQKQVDRARELIKAGSIAKTDLAQLEAQFASDQYSVIVAKNNLIANKTNLKQLLEIPVTDTFKVNFPEIEFSEEYTPLPLIAEAFNASLNARPEIQISQLDKTSADINLKIAKAGYLPSLSMNANISTDYSNQISNSFGSQLNSNQMQRVGLSLNIPIFNRFSTKTTIQKSKINIQQTDLSIQETRKNLLQDVESIYQNSVAGKSRYDAAIIQFSSSHESYKLSEGQFNLGMINSFDLLKAKNSLLSAQKELIQSKYSAILNRKILDFYMGKSITL